MAAGAAATVAIPSYLAALLSPTAALAATTVKATHGSGFCNMGIFLAKERELTKADGVDLVPFSWDRDAEVRAAHNAATRPPVE